MKDRRKTYNRDAIFADHTPLQDQCPQLENLVDEGRYRDLVEALVKLRKQSWGSCGQLSRSLVESAYHLCMASIHCQDNANKLGPSSSLRHDPQTVLESQLRSLCVLLEDIASEAEVLEGERKSEVSSPSLATHLRVLWHRLSKHAATGGVIDISDDRTESNALARLPEDTIDQEDRADSVVSDEEYDMKVYFFGTFRVCIREDFIVDWRNGKSKTIFKYLVSQRQCSVPKECLMELIWPNADPECARNNLNVAIYNIRQSLKNKDNHLHHIIHHDGKYRLNDELNIWTDFDEIMSICDKAEQHGNEGNREKEADTLKKMDDLYGGEFLEEDRFEDWTIPLRQKYNDIYIRSLCKRADIYFDKDRYEHCIETCRKLLQIDPCDEHAHGRLMVCYSRVGHNHLAIRQYRSCVEVLLRELDITPDSATTDLYERIRRHASV